VQDDDGPTPDDILNAWRDTSRAADLVDRLTMVAASVESEAERNAIALDEIADLAEQTARSAERAATRAREAANAARSVADRSGPDPGGTGDRIPRSRLTGS